MNQPSAQAVESSQPTVTKSSWKRKLKAACWIAIVVLALVGSAVWYWRDSASVVDRKVVSSADFATYAPRQAPSGYQVQDDQTSFENEILTYKFASKTDDPDIVVTVQDRPDGFSMTEISKGGSLSSRAMDSGTLYDLSTGETGQYLLDTGVSLVYITSAGDINASTINLLANSLRKIN